MSSVSTYSSTLKLINKLWQRLSRHRQKQFWLILLLMIMALFAEMISIGATLPFLGILTAPEQVYNYQFIQPIVHMLGLTQPQQPTLYNRLN